MTCPSCDRIWVENMRLNRRLADAIEQIDFLQGELDRAESDLHDLDADRRLGRAREYGDPLTDARPDMPQRGVA